jgi:transcriptional regulator with XRE-family HTH domain
MKREVDKSEKQLAQVVGALIAGRRKAKGLTQAQLAELMEIEKETVSRMETGTISPTLTRLAQMAKFLDCEISDFVQTSSPELAEQVMSLVTRMENLSDSQQAIVMQLLGRMVTAMGKLNQRDGKVVEKFLSEIL